MSSEKQYFKEIVQYELSPIENSYDFLIKWLDYFKNPQQDNFYGALTIFTRRCLNFKELLDNPQVVDYFITYAEQSTDKVKVYEMMIESKVGITNLQVYQNFIKLLIQKREFTQVANIFKKSKRYVSFEPSAFKTYKDQIGLQLTSLILKYDKDYSACDQLVRFQRTNLQSEDSRFSFPIQPNLQEQSIKKLALACEAIKASLLLKISNNPSITKLSWLSRRDHIFNPEELCDLPSRNSLIETPKSKLKSNKKMFSQQQLKYKYNSSSPDTKSDDLFTPDNHDSQQQLWNKTQTKPNNKINQLRPMYLQCIRANEVDEEEILKSQSDRLKITVEQKSTPPSSNMDFLSNSEQSLKFEINPALFQSLSKDSDEYENDFYEDKENQCVSNLSTKSNQSSGGRIPFSVIDMTNGEPKSQHKLCMPRISETDSDLLNS